MIATQQTPPQPDNRYRVHRSVKCYVASLACGSGGCTWYFTDSIERVVYLFPGRVEKVQYKTNFYVLQSPERMKELVTEQLRRGGAVHIAGRYVAPHESQVFDAYPFIDASSNEEKETFARLNGSSPDQQSPK